MLGATTEPARKEQHRKKLSETIIHFNYSSNTTPTQTDGKSSIDSKGSRSDPELAAIH